MLKLDKSRLIPKGVGLKHILLPFVSKQQGLAHNFSGFAYMDTVDKTAASVQSGFHQRTV